jgi:hypothetical protein
MGQIMTVAVRKLARGTHFDEAGHVRWRLIGRAPAPGSELGTRTAPSVPESKDVDAMEKWAHAIVDVVSDRLEEDPSHSA